MSISSILDALFPPFCSNCDRPLSSGRSFRICQDCLHTLEWIEHPVCPRCGLPGISNPENCPDCRHLPPKTASFDTARSAFPYRGLARDMVLRLKYARDRHLAKPLGELLARTAGELYPADAAPVIIPVPTHLLRIMDRGYNQARLLAESLADVTGWQMEPELLHRRIGLRSQAGLDRTGRHKNIGHSITLAPGKAQRLAGRHILIVDDVMTTGATMAGAAAAIRTIPASGIQCISVCRSALPDTTRRI